MAITELYVDPSINADSGAGTIGDPYGDLEYCIEQEDWDATNGIRVNIKSGAVETTAAQLETAMADVGAASKSIAWAPGIGARLIFEGYTTAAGDGGRGIIDCAGTHSLISSSSRNYTTFKSLECRNFGANTAILLNDYCFIIDCILHGGTDFCINADLGMTVYGCRFYDFVSASTYIMNIYSGDVSYNWIDCESVLALRLEDGGGLISRNIVNLIRSGSGAFSVRGTVAIEHNSVYAQNAGTGSGVSLNQSQKTLYHINNNLFENLSVGLNLSSLNNGVPAIQGNSFYNCTTNVNAPPFNISESGTEDLAASPFTNAAAGDFSPVDTGSVKEGSLPADWLAEA